MRLARDQLTSGPVSDTMTSDDLDIGQRGLLFLSFDFGSCLELLQPLDERRDTKQIRMRAVARPPALFTGKIAFLDEAFSDCSCPSRSDT